MNPSTALKNLSPFHFTSLFVLFYFFTYPINPRLHCTLLCIPTTHFPSLFTFYRLHFPSRLMSYVSGEVTLVFYNTSDQESLPSVLGDQDMKWTPHIVCKSCGIHLRGWINRKGMAMPFAVPMA